MGMFDRVDDEMLKQCMEIVPYETAKGTRHEIKIDKKKLKFLKELEEYI
jgi:hypothetical protein